MASTALVRSWWAEYECQPSKLEVIEFFGRGPVRVAPEIVPAVIAVEQALDTSGYQRSGGPIGSYVCRNIAEKSSRSLHAYGVALDIEYDVNPRWTGPALRRGWGSDPHCRFSEQNIDAIESVVNVYGEPIFRWLGYITNPDSMHIQVNVPPNRTEVEMPVTHFKIGELQPEYEEISWLLFQLEGGTVDANSNSAQIYPTLPKNNVREVTEDDFNLIGQHIGLDAYHLQRLKTDGLYRWGKEIAALREAAYT